MRGNLPPVLRPKTTAALAWILAIAGCTSAGPTAEPTPTLEPSATLTPTTTPTPTGTATVSPTLTDTPPPSATPTASDTPTPTDTPTVTATPSPEPVTATALENANCRAGPDPAYLYVASFSQGENASVDGRNSAKTWLWIQIEGYPFHCWVVASAASLSGDLNQVPRASVDPPSNPSVPAASGVGATRNASTVSITWSPAPPSVDLHYLIRADVCNGQYVVTVVQATTSTSFSVQDKQGCSSSSSAKLFVVNKLGYSAPVSIPWP